VNRTRFLAILAVVAIVLAGCSNLPRGGEVHAVSPSATQEGEIGLVAQPPASGATPEQIVAGFLAASAAGLDDDFAVARQYLTGTAASDWNPLAEVRVYPDTQNLQSSTEDSGAIRVSVGSIGTLSDEGVYSESSNDATITTEFSLARNSDGEWRIASLEDGFFLSEHLFGQLYVESPLYFLSADQSAMVADLHWYPRRSFATQAVRALLAGPSDWLSGGVGTAFPDGTSLENSVTVDDGVATVNLSSEVLSASAEQRGKLLAQLRRTLISLSSIQQVEVTVEGAALTASSMPDLSIYPFGSYALSVLADGVPATVSDGEASPVVSANVVDGLDLTALAVGYQDSGAVYAALSQDGSTLYSIESATDTVTELGSGSNLVDPSIDVYGWIWSGESTSQGSVTAYQAGSSDGVSVTASWLKGVTITGIAVSREGSRVIVVCDVGGDTVVYASSITRDGDGVPSSLNEPVQIAQRLATVTDVSWMSATDLVVLGTSAAGSETGLYRLPIGGPMERLASPSSPIQIVTSGRDEQSIAGVTSAGVVIGRSGGAWRSLITDVTWAAYPG